MLENEPQKRPNLREIIPLLQSLQKMVRKIQTFDQENRENNQMEQATLINKY